MVLMSCAGIVLTIVALAAPANAQANRAAGGPFARTAVLNAPFSADATTIFRETLPRWPRSRPYGERPLLPRFAGACTGGIRDGVGTIRHRSDRGHSQS